MSQYPLINAGQRLTASLVQSLVPLEAYKTAATTRTSTTVLADDPDLTLSLAASAVYDVIFYLHYAAISAAQFKTAWTVPASATGVRSARGLASTVSDSVNGGVGDVRSGVHAFATAVTYGDRNNASNQCFALEEARVTTTTAGTLAIQWAQVTSNATGSVLSAGSYMRVKRIA